MILEALMVAQLSKYYSVNEINRMRWDLYILAAPKDKVPLEFIRDEQAFNARIEDQLRTYMLNGTTPAELDWEIISKGLMTEEELSAHAPKNP